MKNSIFTLLVFMFIAGGISAQKNAEVISMQIDTFDAQFIRMEIPPTVETSETFLVKIFMKNTGSSSWGNIADTFVDLISHDTIHNKTWGTDFIILGQGRVVDPGDTVDFVSYLQAPAIVGKYPFAWRLQDSKSKNLHGQIAADSIEVIQGDTSKYPDPTFDPKVITMDDFEYMGTFNVPTTPGDYNSYTESGLSFRRYGDGTKTLFANSGTYTYKLFEMEIPVLVDIQAFPSATPNTAVIKKIWGTINKNSWGTPAGGPMFSNSGFYWDNATRILYWTFYHGYYTQNPFPVLGATRLDDNGDTTYLGHWFLPAVEKWKAYWGGVTSVPQLFADTYLGGRKFAIGFGGYFSICASASRGPAIAAFAEPNISEDTLDLKEMVYYNDTKPAPRNGNYFNSNIGYWNTDAINLYKGYWTGDDHSRAGVFIQTPNKEGYISFTSMGTGRIGYDYGAVTHATTTDYWYIYSLDELGKAAQGIISPKDVLPHSFNAINYPGNGWDWSGVKGACFDEVDKILYIYKPWSLDQYPAIHAYKFNDVASGIEKQDELNASISISPNPCSSVLKIKMKDPAINSGVVSLEIIDMQGRKIQSFKTNYSELYSGYTTSVSDLPAGIYLIRINDAQQGIHKTSTFIKIEKE